MDIVFLDKLQKTEWSWSTRSGINRDKSTITRLPAIKAATARAAAKFTHTNLWGMLGEVLKRPWIWVKQDIKGSIAILFNILPSQIQTLIAAVLQLFYVL